MRFGSDCSYSGVGIFNYFRRRGNIEDFLSVFLIIRVLIFDFRYGVRRYFLIVFVMYLIVFLVYNVDVNRLR